MTDPADHDRRLSTADHASDIDIQRSRSPAPVAFAPIFTLVENASTRTMNHPHVRYIFSDDDPESLTQSLIDYQLNRDTSESGSGSGSGPGSGPAPAKRAMILDLARDENGGYSVSWASSLSPSWAVLSAQISQISPPSSDAGHGSNSGSGGNGAGVTGSNNENSRPDRLMLRIEGIETGPLSSSAELRRSDETSRQRPVSSASGRERPGTTTTIATTTTTTAEGDDYAGMLDEFEKRMATLRKVVNASEDRRKKTAFEIPGAAEDRSVPIPQQIAPEDNTAAAPPPAVA
ncbi:hypothetical protein GGR50DRAFT_454696 [Xylaria sp. CBS 124048]|nr:hypothetical protein GGR50DRAFT_454696 [Xylaria sp. CBS 124048]